ncbi:FIG001454: Transglutaminase-like enzymes,putative cysteine proteases [Pseudoalteromonas luteoviolacea B = ATCC 29581]|nr:FIG001454: Transglutaminase-like enzymes,putative cysteine proteases [Pseudoalteromonas luteoviolacea B = ATCC 29581]
MILITQLLLLFTEIGIANSALILLVVIWANLNEKKVISNGVLNSVTVVAVLVSILSLGTAKSLSIFVSLLLIALALKLCQIPSVMRYQKIVVLSFFTTSLTFLFEQSIGIAFIVVSQWITLIACLLSLQNQTIRTLSKRRFKRHAIGLTFCIPMAFILVTLLPKLPSFWTMPTQNSAKTGLNESLDPFNISQLSNSDELVFRAKWSKSQPLEPLYWRAIVHDFFDGNAWRESHLMFFDTAKFKNSEIDYSVIVEPSSNKWLYGLNYSDSKHPQVNTNEFGTLFKTDNSLKNQFEYKVFSTSVKQEVLSDHQFQHYTRLPIANNMEARKLALALKRQSTSVHNFVTLLKTFFIENRFVYTLTPAQSISDNSIDEFLFNNRQGFCGHYASSVAFLLRAGNIPSRIVSGYLGGKLNSEHNYTSVRQFDAHAWVEYFDGMRWQRLDPTGWIAPDRMTGSILDSDTYRQQLIDNLGFNILGLNHYELLLDVQLFLDNIDYQWTRWIVTFDTQRQNEFFSDLLGQQWLYKTASLLLIVVLALGTLFFIWTRWQIRDKRHKAIIVFETIQRETNTRHLSPINTCILLQQRYPEIQQEINDFKQQYSEFRYGQVELSTSSLKKAHALLKYIKQNNKKSL